MSSRALARCALALTLTVAATVQAAPDAAPAKAAAASGAPAAAASTRTVDQILADYVAAVGGEAAWKKHKNLVMRRELSVAAMNVTGTERRWATSAGKLLVEVELPGLGKSRQGTDGKVRWAEDPINGLRILAGAEAEQMRIESTWNSDLQLKKVYKKVSVVPTPASAPAGASYECLDLVPAIGHTATTCFDAKTHLRVFQQGKEATPQGDTPYTVQLTDWRDVGGVKVPHGQALSVGPLTISGKIVELTFDTKIDDAMFRLPKPAAAKAVARPADKKAADEKAPAAK